MIYPQALFAPQPNPDLPDHVVGAYREAGMVVNISPRAAAALLRLAVDELVTAIGATGRDLNDKIADLVKRGLPLQVQQALDFTRVVGNNAVHPGTMDLRDDVQTVSTLFGCINLIAESLVTQPRQMQELYDRLPESYRAHVEKRDRPNRA